MTSDIDPFRLRGLATWRSAVPPVSLFDYLTAEVALPALAAVVALLRPSFVVERGCVLLADRFDRSNFDEWWEQLRGDRARIEAVVNHVHLWDIWDPEPDDPEAEPLMMAIAEAIAASWRCALSEEFPEREFAVSVGSNEDDYGPTVTFQSVNKAAAE